MIPRALLLLSIATSLSAQVTFDRILNAAKEPQNWLTYSGTTMSQRYTPLTQITPSNVKNLQQAWIWQAKSLEKYEASSLVVDGILYTVQAPNDVVALDAATGRPFWQFTYNNAANARACCGRVNRGLAILGDTLYMGTIDAHLLALDAKAGTLLWNTHVADSAEKYSLTMAPLVVKDKIIIGTAGGDMGIRGFIAAYDAKTGKQVWKFYTIPGPGEPGHETWDKDSWKQGGAAIWTTGSYDPQSNLTYWGIGNPGPDWDGREREGDNLYSDCVVALDADTGKLKWYYQFTPHDEMDYDSTQVPVLADMDWQGRPRKVMMWANRNGLFYVIDRSTGQFLLGKPFVKVNWMDGFDEKGRPRRVPGTTPTPSGTLVQPTVLGATNWYSPSYSPRTGLFYVSSWENTGTIAIQGAFPRATGNTPMAAPNLQPNNKLEDEGYGVVKALDPRTGLPKWEFKMNDITWAGVMTTATDLVFTGNREGYFFALDARTGDLLWRTNLGGQVNSAPTSFSINGKQYISVAAGTSLFAFALP